VLALVDPLAPLVEWAWKSSSLANRRPASKLPCRKRWSRSSAPLASQSPGSSKTQPSARGPQKAANSSIGRPFPAWIAPSRSHTGFSAAPRAEPGSGSSPGDVRELLGEDECAAEAPRVGQLAGDHIAPARLAEADRNLAQRLGQVKLGQLAGTVDGALKGPGRRPVAGPELAQQVVEDRLPPQ
jgi:hypothetical protein